MARIAKEISNLEVDLAISDSLTPPTSTSKFHKVVLLCTTLVSFRNSDCFQDFRGTYLYMTGNLQKEVKISSTTKTQH